jgi:hypothetical protein
MSIVLGIIFLCFVVPAVMYPCLFTYQRPPDVPQHRTAAQLEEQRRLDELAWKSWLEERKRQA